MRNRALCGSWIAALAPAILPKGVGAYSAAVLYYEMRGFERFTNRRQVGSMTGFVPRDSSQ